MPATAHNEGLLSKGACVVATRSPAARGFPIAPFTSPRPLTTPFHLLPSPVAGRHIMSATPPVYDARTTQFQTTLTPYLQLSHRLSLTWLAYPILSLLFVAFRLQLSSASAQDAADRAKDDLIASCRAAEKAATAAASMPRYMARATNEQIVDAVNGTMRGARAALILALTVMEAIINFIVDMYRSTFLCFLELVVRGALSILIGAVDEVRLQGFMLRICPSYHAIVQQVPLKHVW